MTDKQDFTIPNGIGIRILNGRTCQVIRQQRGMWKEIGRAYALPLTDEDLEFTKADIPVSVMAVALRAYEMKNPQSDLRRRLQARNVLPPQRALTAAL